MKIFCAQIIRKKVKNLLKTKQIVFTWELKVDSTETSYQVSIDIETKSLLIKRSNQELTEIILEDIDAECQANITD